MFLESIRLVNGRIMNLRFHQDRVNTTYAQVYPGKEPILLKNHLKVSPRHRKGVFKVRIIYTDAEVEVQFHPYVVKQVSSLQLVYDDDIDYSSKYVNRDVLTRLYDQRKECDDILIVKNNRITDAYYSNVAFLKNGVWHTPRCPLLGGTRRKQLLGQKRIILADIKPTDIKQYSHVSLFNALIPFKKVVISLSKVYA